MTGYAHPHLGTLPLADDLPLEIHRPRPGFAFCRVELGADDPAAFLAELPPIDLLYSALPNPATLSWWRGYAKLPYDYDGFFAALTAVIQQVDPPECYIEAHDPKERMLRWLRTHYPLVEVRSVLYSAPINGRGPGLAKCRKPSPVLLASRSPLAVGTFTASHELVEAVLAGRSSLRTFDPCIGKGLLLRSCLAHGHACYGMDADATRLACCLETLTRWEDAP